MISVCIPTYNGSLYIKEQLDSILTQLGADDEIIISDDHSTDDTLSIIKSYNDPRIKIFIHDRINNPFSGTYRNIYYVYKNVEYALNHAKGDFIFLSDQDDVWLPNKVARVMREFNSGAKCVLHNTIVVNQDKDVLNSSYFSITKPSRSLIRFICLNFYQGASMAFSRDVLLKSLPFSNRFIISHDHWIACFAWCKEKKISFIQEPLLLYRRHGRNVSPSSEHSKNSLYFKISYRIHLLYSYAIAMMRKHN